MDCRAGDRQEDKPEVGARVAWSGVGLRLKALSPKPAEIRQAVRSVLQDGRYRRAASAMAERMARSGGLDALARIVDDVVGASPTRSPRREAAIAR